MFGAIDSVFGGEAVGAAGLCWHWLGVTTCEDVGVPATWVGMGQSRE